jgi:hypothetical protein
MAGELPATVQVVERLRPVSHDIDVVDDAVRPQGSHRQLEVIVVVLGQKDTWEIACHARDSFAGNEK